MSYRYRLLAITLLTLVFTVGASATDAPATAADDITTQTAAQGVPAAVVPSIAQIAEQIQTRRGPQTPTTLTCTYTCDPDHEPRPLCPFVLDAPPPTCVNGCCVYDTGGCDACSFASDCGAEASCWGGCCYYWN